MFTFLKLSYIKWEKNIDEKTDEVEIKMIWSK